MAARSGMTELIEWLRALTETALNDYTLNGIAYWSDDQLQSALDRFVLNIVDESMTPRQFNDSGTIKTFDYTWQHEHVERFDALTPNIFRVIDSSGIAIDLSSGVTINYDQRVMSFATDQQNASRFLSYRAYDMNRTAALIWNAKAAHLANRVDLKADAFDIKRSQLLKHAREMAQAFTRSAAPRVGRAIRADVRF